MHQNTRKQAFRTHGHEKHDRPEEESSEPINRAMNRHKCHSDNDIRTPMKLAEGKLPILTLWLHHKSCQNSKVTTRKQESFLSWGEKHLMMSKQQCVCLLCWNVSTTKGGKTESSHSFSSWYWWWMMMQLIIGFVLNVPAEIRRYLKATGISTVRCWEIKSFAENLTCHVTFSFVVLFPDPFWLSFTPIHNGILAVCWLKVKDKSLI